MKKSKLQALIEFVSSLMKVQSAKRPVDKTFSNMKKTVRSLALLLLITGMSAPAMATVYYTQSTGNWNSPSTWSTVGYGSPVNSGTYPGATDIANIGDGYTVFITANAAANTINIGQGVSGALSFQCLLSFSLVASNITVNTGAVFNDASVTDRVKSLIVGRNFSNFGTVDLYVTKARGVDLTFGGSTPSVVSGSGSWDLGNVSVNKNASTQTVEAQQNAFETAIRAFFNTRGTYIHNNAGTFNVPGTTTNYTINKDANFKSFQGNLNFAPNGSILYLFGGLYVNGGNVTVGSATSNIGITTQNLGVRPYLEVTSGVLEVRAGIAYNQVASPGSFAFNMTGGTVLLNTGTAGSVRNIFCVYDAAGSSFTMSGGTIVLQRPNVTSINVDDFSLPGINGTVTSTGGIVQFGNNSTPAGSRFNFVPYPSVTQPHFLVSGSAGSGISLAPSQGSTSNFRLLSLSIDPGMTFDIRSINNAYGDTKQMTLMGTVDGVNALYNNGTFTARQSTVTFNTSGAQAIGGSTVTTFYNLSVNNASGITLNRSANVQNFLALVNGILYTTSANVLTVLSSGSASIGANNTYVNGPMVHTVATSALVTRTYPIGKNGAYRPVVLTLKHSNATPVTYRAELFNSPASGLPYTLPPSIANVSNIRYVQFNRSAVANFSSGTIQMYYDADDGVQDYTSLLVAHDDGISQWQNFGGTATGNITGSITSNSFSNFNSYFALANPPGGGNPLPVELTRFTASLVNQKVFVDWTTASEINNDYFTVERSGDNKSFESIAGISGSGTTSLTHNYQYVDEHPLRGMNYYRLKQTDYDGTTTVFRTVAVFNNSGSHFDIYPNPSTARAVTLSYASADLNAFEVFVQDITGKLIPSHTESAERFGEVRLVIDDNSASRGGIFIVTARTADLTLKQRLLISGK